MSKIYQLLQPYVQNMLLTGCTFKGQKIRPGQQQMVFPGDLVLPKMVDFLFEPYVMQILFNLSTSVYCLLSFFPVSLKSNWEVLKAS